MKIAGRHHGRRRRANGRSARRASPPPWPPHRASPAPRRRCDPAPPSCRPARPGGSSRPERRSPPRATGPCSRDWPGRPAARASSSRLPVTRLARWKTTSGAAPASSRSALPGDREVGLPPAQVGRGAGLRPARNRVDATTGREQGADEMGAEEAGGAGDEDGNGLQESAILPQSGPAKPL